MVVENITVMGRKISYELKDVAISKLKYYPENPRVNYIISKHPPKKITQNFIEQELLRLDSTKERIKDLEENKGLIDEVYVLGDKVVEGNTRLCAFRRLSKKYPDEPRWKKIKARILHNSVNEEELFYILKTFHMKGKTPWDAYEKASYIHKMIRVLNKKPENIAKDLGKQTKTIEAMLNAFEVMSKQYLCSSGNPEFANNTRDDLRKYSYFEAFFLQKDLAERANKTPAFVKEFVEWVKEDRFKKAQDVRDLPKILNNKKAFKEFYVAEPESAYSDAMQILYKNKPEIVDKFYMQIREFRELIQATEVFKIKDEINKNKKAELNKCFKELKKFCKEVGLGV